MKKAYRISGLRTLSKGGGLIFCGTCEKILGSINKQGYNYINLSIVCTCGNYGSLEISRQGNTADPFKRVNSMPDDKNGIAVCKHCRTPIFGVIANRVKTYAFYTECVCGEKYDIKSNFSKRLGETIEILREEKLKKRYGV